MKKILVLLSFFALTGCGFQPMYGTHSAASSLDQETASSFSQIKIAVLPDREGQLLRNELIDRLSPRGVPENPKYELGFGPIVLDKRELDLTKSAEATRSQIVAHTDLKLINIETGDLVLSRPLKSISSYNILPSEFATNVTENAARESALHDLARQAELQLSLYFNRQPSFLDEAPVPADRPLP